MHDIWAAHRELLNQGITGCLDDTEFGSGQLVREQIEASEGSGYQTAALACMAASQAAGGSPNAALPGAVAIAYMSQMAIVFTGLENAGGASSLSTAWGMPRSLNAGDAMFALAQKSLLDSPDDLPAEVLLQSTAILDTASRVLVDALLARRTDSDANDLSQRSLLPAALALGALFGGRDTSRSDRLFTLGREWSTLPEDDLQRMLASDPAGWLAT